MNQLIKKFIAESTICQGHPQIDGSYFDKEKFAELIVLECVRYFNEDYQRDFDTLWREDLSKGIKEHFGVEE
jgi:hypothetical protein